VIVLYNPRSSAARKPILPLALLAIGSVIEGRHPYAIVDGNLEDDAFARIDALLHEPTRGLPPVLAVTAMPGPQTIDAVPLAKRLKAAHPHVPFVWGGYFPTQHWRACLASPPGGGRPVVDFVVRGHGESVFVDLLDALASGPTPERLRTIAGLAWRDLSGVVANADAPVPRVERVGEVPLHRVPVDRYVRRTFLGARTLGMHTSYGCPYLCNFCAVVSMVNGRWNAWSADRVVRAIEEYRRLWGVDAVEMYDNNFFVQESRCREVGERLAGRGIAWWGEGRVDTLLGFDDTTWRAMAAGGLRMVFMGAESGSAETLARMDKGGTLTPEATIELVARMRTFGVVPELSFVVGAPPDPAKDVDDTIAFVRRVKAANPATEIVLYLYTPEPVDGDLWERARERGFRWPDTLEGWADPAVEDLVQRRSIHLPWVDPVVHRKLQGFERVLNARFPTTTDPRLRGPVRWVLKGTSAWRWRLGAWNRPIELAALQRLVRYRRPETSGF
jgi:hypothetical protein